MLSTLDIVALVIGALGGLTGAAAIITAICTGRNASKANKLAAKKADIDDLRSIIGSLRDENARLQTRIVTLETCAAISRTDITGLRDIIEELRKENERLRDKITVLEDGIVALRKENSTLRSDNTKMRKRLRELENGKRNDEQDNG